MAMLMITPEKIAEIKAAVERASKHPVRLPAEAFVSDRAVLKLAERKPGFERPPSEHIVFEGGYRAAISFEEQPAGMCRHFSLSSPKPGTIPMPAFVAFVAELFGIEMETADRIWLEEFDPGHYAVNVVVLEANERGASHCH